MPTNTPSRVGGDISYEAYLRYLEDKGERWRDSGDGATDMAVSAADWERHTPAQRREAVAMHSGAYGGFTFGDDDPLAQQFIAQFGRYPTGYRTELSNKPISGYIVSENAPSGADYNNWEGSAIDPSRVFRDPNTGMYVWEAGNIKPEVIVGLQDRDAQSYNQHALMMAAAFGGLAGGHAMLSNGLLGGAGDAAGTGWAQGGGFGAGGISPETAAGAGGMGSGATSAAAGAAGATPAAGAAGSGSVGFTGPFAPGMEGAGLIDDFLINNGMSGLAGGPLTAALGGNLGGALGSAGQWLTDPWNLGRLGLTLASGLGGGEQPPGGGGSAPWSGVPFDFFGGGNPAGASSSGSINPYTAAQLAAHQQEDAMGYYGMPSIRSSYGPYPQGGYQGGGMGGIGQMMGMGGYQPYGGSQNPITSMIGRMDPYSGGATGGINPRAGMGMGGGMGRMTEQPAGGGMPYTFDQGQGRADPYTGQSPGSILPRTWARAAGNTGYNGGMQDVKPVSAGINMGGLVPAGGGMPYTFDQGQGRADPYAGGATGGINPGAGRPMGGGVNRMSAMDQNALGQIRESLRPVMGNLVDQGSFGDFIQRQAGGTSLDPSQFGQSGTDRYGRPIWRMGTNNIMGYGDAARVQQRIMGEGGGGPLNTWASQLTGQSYNPASPYQLQGAAQDTRQQGRQAVSPALMSMLQQATPGADQWSALMEQLGRGYGR